MPRETHHRVPYTINQSIVSLTTEFIAYNRAIELSEATIRTRKTHLKQFAVFCTSHDIDTVYEITNVLVDTYFAHFRIDHSKSTTNTSKRIMRAFLIWVIEYKEIDIGVNPGTIRITKDRNKLPQAIDAAIICRVLAQCQDIQDRLIIALFVETGIRISELCSIQVSDVRNDELEIHGKGLVDRTVHITASLASELRDFIGHRKEGSLFRNTRQLVGTPLRKDTVWRRVKKCFRDITNIDMHPHQLRHTFAISLLEAGCDLVTIKELMGHEDINTTMIYLRVTNKQIKSAYKKHCRSYLT